MEIAITAKYIILLENHYLFVRENMGSLPKFSIARIMSYYKSLRRRAFYEKSSPDL
jgi:hypothetical protein